MLTYKIVGPIVPKSEGIEFVKAFRRDSGLGLRESKEILDFLKSGYANITLIGDDDNRRSLFNAICGMFVDFGVSASRISIPTAYGPVHFNRCNSGEVMEKENKPKANAVDTSASKNLKQLLQEALLVATDEERFSTAECILKAIQYIR